MLISHRPYHKNELAREQGAKIFLMIESGFDNDAIGRIAGIVDRACEELGESAGVVESWRERLASLENLRERTFRIAVAGTVKSGKTTLVNSLLGDDLLKRGAGIVTSVVTKVRGNDNLDAVVKLKGWREVNREGGDAGRDVRNT